MPSKAICTCNGASTKDGYDTTPSNTVTIALLDKTGVNAWDLTCLYTDDKQSVAYVNANQLVVDQLSKTAILTTTSNTRGGSYIFQSTANGSGDSITFGIFAIGTSGLRLLAANQTTEGNSEFGWLPELNNIFREVLDDTISNATDFGVANITTTGTATTGWLHMTGNLVLNGAVGIVEAKAGTTTYQVDGYYYYLTNADPMIVLVFVSEGVDQTNRKMYLPTNSPVGHIITVINTGTSGLTLKDLDADDPNLPIEPACGATVIYVNEPYEKWVRLSV